MARDYWFAFGAQPSVNTGLAPTFITFVNSAGTTIAPPTIAETYSGTGLYKANYNATQTIAFVLDGATTGLGTNNRYIFGVFDPQDTMGQTLVAVGNTAIAIGLSGLAFGQTGVAIGTSNIALGMTNVAIGLSNIALGNTAIAFGVSTIAFGSTLVGLGNTGLAFGQTGVAIGTTNLGYGLSNISLGMTNVAIGMTNLGYGLSNISLGTTNVAIGLSNIALGTTAVAIGTSLSFALIGIGNTASSFGDSTTNPVTLFGYVKRLQEFLEGNQVYTKSTGGLVFSSRGSSYVLASKTVSDSVSQTTKT